MRMRNRQSVHMVRVMVRGETVEVLLRRLWGWKGSVQREGQAHSPTKSDGDSAVLGGLVRSKGLSSFCDG